MTRYDTDSDSDSEGSQSFSEEESTSDEEYTEKGGHQQIGSKRKHGTNPRQKKTPQQNYIAHVTATANDAANASGSASRVEQADSNILAKIRKAMQLATHSGTGEAEAKAAMRMAIKMMQSQNLTQADLIANETAEERLTRAGQSTVTITSTRNKTVQVKCQRWHNDAVEAACEAFDVQVYSESSEDRDFVTWVFYGLADNTVAAALSFEMLHNQIEIWSIERKGELKGRSGPNSYRIGVARRVLKDAEEENRKALKKAEEEEKRRIEEEAEAAEAARAAELARLNTPAVADSISPKVEEEPKVSLAVDDISDKAQADSSDDDDDSAPPPVYEENDADMVDYKLGADFTAQDDVADIDLDALEREVKGRSKPLNAPLRPKQPTAYTAKPEPEVPTTKREEDAGSSTHWTSALQLRGFRDNAKSIAENYLKETGLKVYKGSKWRPIQYDTAAFNKGWKDGQKVDLKRRRIEDKKVVKRKKFC
ncbi:hypothetical protein GALMADRAFT_241123 [Galerina marginata CBS 339.88]|uniref:Uncharacterized protein n=1 Tax=Galerina marginata (strain CBS 339.88) TaxID=685588 RepID=A0A067TEC5_GALM3|nr:hypothetical protein GALMADRAFT_241123 [Galerina marginata CBS 339.88]